MLSIAIILFVLLLIVSGCLIVSLSKNLDQMSALEIAVELVTDGIHDLEMIYERVEAKTKLEVLSDDPVVRDLVSDIREARDTVQFVLDKLRPLMELSDELDDEDLEGEL